MRLAHTPSLSLIGRHPADSGVVEDRGTEGGPCAAPGRSRRQRKGQKRKVSILVSVDLRRAYCTAAHRTQGKSALDCARTGGKTDVVKLLGGLSLSLPRALSLVLSLYAALTLPLLRPLLAESWAGGEPTKRGERLHAACRASRWDEAVRLVSQDTEIVNIEWRFHDVS